jgi:hypothetical protein
MASRSYFAAQARGICLYWAEVFASLGKVKAFVLNITIAAQTPWTPCGTKHHNQKLPASAFAAAVRVRARPGAHHVLGQARSL